MTSLGPSLPVPPSACPYCEHELDGAAMAGGAAAPSPHDVTICIQCTGIMVFTDDLRPRMPTVLERRILGADPTVRKMRAALSAMHAARSR